MRLVVDASVALKWVIAEADSPAAEALLTHELLAPALLLVECANALWRIVQRGEITAEIAGVRLQALRTLGIDITETGILMPRALQIGCELAHPVYDCVYLAAAERYSAALVTADQRFTRRLAGHSGRYAEIIPLAQAAAN